MDHGKIFVILFMSAFIAFILSCRGLLASFLSFVLGVFCSISFIIVKIGFCLLVALAFSHILYYGTKHLFEEYGLGAVFDYLFGSSTRKSSQNEFYYKGETSKLEDTKQKDIQESSQKKPVIVSKPKAWTPEDITPEMEKYFGDYVRFYVAEEEKRCFKIHETIVHQLKSEHKKEIQQLESKLKEKFDQSSKACHIKDGSKDLTQPIQANSNDTFKSQNTLLKLSLNRKTNDLKQMTASHEAANTRIEQLETEMAKKTAEAEKVKIMADKVIATQANDFEHRLQEAIVKAHSDISNENVALNQLIAEGNTTLVQAYQDISQLQMAIFENSLAKDQLEQSQKNSLAQINNLQEELRQKEFQLNEARSNEEITRGQVANLEESLRSQRLQLQQVTAAEKTACVRISELEQGQLVKNQVEQCKNCSTMKGTISILTGQIASERKKLANKTNAIQSIFAAIQPHHNIEILQADDTLSEAAAAIINGLLDAKNELYSLHEDFAVEEGDVLSGVIYDTIDQYERKNSSLVRCKDALEEIRLVLEDLVIPGLDLRDPVIAVSRVVEEMLHHQQASLTAQIANVNLVEENRDLEVRLNKVTDEANGLRMEAALRD